MRQDTKVTLKNIHSAEYNPEQGGRSSPVIDDKVIIANVSIMGRDDQLMLYGKVTQDSVVIRYQGIIKERYEEAEINGETYKITRQVRYRHRTVFLGIKR